MFRFRLILPAILVALALASPGNATPLNRTALADYLGPLALARGVDCRTCHLAAKPTDEDHEHNAFGTALVEARKTLRKVGKPADIRSRIKSIVESDNDGDGINNLIELLTGHNPGDAADKPGPAELKTVDAKRALWNKHQTGYQWRPLESVRRPSVPEVGEPHPIDAFLESARLDQNVTAQPEAAKLILLRRVTLDLTGLPPTRAEMNSFLADASADAYEKVVDRLLASPRYGERWGRHWMDIWRYSDWAGYGKEIRESVPHIWQWRDWIIESLNADKGYDRMVREMLAGDEIAPTDPATLRATGFLIRNSYIFNRNVVLDNTVEHTAKAFLGLTLNCARCHDHMYDPIAQTEYYSFRAIFEPCLARTDRVPGQPDVKTLGLPRAYDAKPDAKTNLFIRGNEAMPDPDRVCPPAVPAALGGELHIKALPLAREAAHPDSRQFVIAESRTAARQQMQATQDALKSAQLTLARAITAPLETTSLPFVAFAPSIQFSVRTLDLARADAQLTQARFAALEAVLATEHFEAANTLNVPEGQRAAELTVIAQRQQSLAQARRDLLAAEIAAETSVAKARAAATAKLPAVRTALAKAEADAAAPLNSNFARRSQANYPDVSSGRRLALANWLTAKQNPLAARVAVNHMWARHFGQGLVPTVFDFGRNGQRPTHPALLDWLAAEFMDRDWSMKQLHRLIVTSKAYRMDSHSELSNAGRDPDNKYLWRITPRRMEAELVRDSVLAISGQIDLKVGGPDLDQTAGLTTFRRSIYYRHANEKQVPFLLIFDAASANECYQRPASIVPQQALALANSPLTRQASEIVAKKLHDEIGVSDTAFVEVAFRQILNRPPTADESRECTAFLATPGEPLSQRTSLIHVLLNHHDFVTIH